MLAKLAAIRRPCGKLTLDQARKVDVLKAGSPAFVAKLAIVRSVGIGRTTVTQIAQRHDVTRQQIYRWRHDLKGKGFLSREPETVFLPVDFSEMDPEAAKPYTVSAEQDGRFEVVLRNGRSLRVDAHLNVSALTRLIKTVETA